MLSAIDLAFDYFTLVHAARISAVAGEPEAQLTTPVSNLFCQLVDIAGLGALQLVRETRLDRTRPDFAALHTKGGKTHQKGYIELKSPDIGVDASLWTGRNARQWEHMKIEAEILIVCNGKLAQLYRMGEPIGGAAALPYTSATEWDHEPLTQLIGRFLDTVLTPVVSVNDLSRRLAVRTADLRDRLLWLFDHSGLAALAARGGYASWKQHVHPDASERNFADGVSQVVAYGMVLAALSTTNADADGDGHITVGEARKAIRSFSPVMAAAFAPLLDKAALFEAVRVELGALETLVSAINPARVNRSADRRGDPWLYFYEDFLSVYDAEARRQAGVYYTPVAVVQAMVKIVDHILVDKFDKRLGFADPTVVTLDPATGTGTFPLAVIDQAVRRAELLRGQAGKAQAATTLAKGLFAFELLPGPYSVAHLRLTQRLHELAPGLLGSARVVLTDTLESPLDPREQLSLFGDAEVLAAEQNRAKRIKLEQRVTVVIGNPPYRRVEREMAGRGSGGWVVEGRVPGRKKPTSLFDDILDVARKKTIFSHHASLYNLYVYFWRWAIWKSFEAHGDGPGVVAFITASSWLAGPGFVGLRQLVRQSCDEAWVIDLGGDNKGANPEENIFSIETPVAIVILVRVAGKNPKLPAEVHYRKINGTAAQKLEAMAAIAASETPLSGTWTDSPTGWTEPFTPQTGDSHWYEMPSLADIFPWQQPGCKFGRTWPISASKAVLEDRWERFVSAPTEEKPSLFSTANSGRTTYTNVGTFRRLIDTTEGEPFQPIVRYGFRSFDRQWAFQDPRMAKTESPSLWATSSDKQIFLSSLMTGKISTGPSLTVSAHVPDLHYFSGRGGKDIIPLYRNALGTQPNLPKGLAKFLAKRLEIPLPSVEDIAAYTYTILSCSEYRERFAKALETPGARVPVTTNPALWGEAVSLGRYLIWLHTYAERFRDSSEGRGRNVPLVAGIGWNLPVTVMPSDTSAIAYDANNGLLTVGNGVISGVSLEVWSYSVSGMPVLKKWLGYRTLKGTGKATSSKSLLDKIRPVEWLDEWNDELLDLIRVLTITIEKQVLAADLLMRICNEPLIPANEFPSVRQSDRMPPKDLAVSLFDEDEDR